jgi:hypothetical protein
MNYRIVPYIVDSQLTNIEPELCQMAFDLMVDEKLGDKLADNYTIAALKLDKMLMWTFVFDSDNNPIHAAGCQIMSDNVIRVYSRYYAFKQFRTDSTIPLDKVDNFMDLHYWLPSLTDYPLIIWSRERSAGFFRKLQRHRADVFENWSVHPHPIEILWKDNYQHIFYTGNIAYITELAVHQ